MSKYIIAVAMLVWGIVQLFVFTDVGGNITGNVWLVGAVLLAWMPER